MKHIKKGTKIVNKKFSFWSSVVVSIVSFSVIRFVFIPLYITYIPNRVFELPHSTIQFESTDAGFPRSFAFCYSLGMFSQYPTTCINNLVTDAQGNATLPVDTIVSKNYFAHIGNLSIRSLGVKNNEPCVYDVTLLPDPWRSDILNDSSTLGFTEVDGKTIALTCRTDIDLSTVSRLRMPPVNHNN